MKRCAVLASMGLIVLTGFSPCEAAIRTWSVEAGAHGGYEKLDGDTGIKDTGVAGVRLGLAIRPAFTVEAFYDRFTSESENPPLPSSEYTQEYTGLRLVGTFGAGEDVKVLPYIAAGGGRVETEFDRGGTRPPETDQASYGEVAAGARYFLWKGLTLRGEAAMRHSRTLDTTHANFQLTVGASILFLGAK